MKPRTAWPDRLWSLRRRLTIAVLLLATYVNSYLLLSATGTYRSVPTGSRLVQGTQFALTFNSIWRPRGVEWDSSRGSDSGRRNVLGYFYWPLICVDRFAWHPTRSHWAFTLRNQLPS